MRRAILLATLAAPGCGGALETHGSGRTCTLVRLPPAIAARTVLFGYLSALTSEAHVCAWLAHYASLGVRLAASEVVVDASYASSAAVDRTVRLVRGYGAATRVTPTYSSDAKKAYVNAFMARQARGS